MWLLLTYIAVIGAVSVLGGHLSSIGQTTHRRAQLVVSFIAGFILGLALFHLLPHSLSIADEHGSHLEVMCYLVAGIVVLIFVLHVFHFHSHQTLGSDDEDVREREPQPDNSSRDTRTSMWALTTGLGIHTIIEGVTLGMTVDLKMLYYGKEGLLPGLATFIAIALHKPLDAYSVLTLADRAGYSKRKKVVINLVFALICPVVAVAAYYSGIILDEYFSHGYVALVLAFAAGAFLCISLSDLLPEIQFHSHDRGWLVLALLLGLAASLALFYVETLLGLNAH